MPDYYTYGSIPTAEEISAPLTEEMKNSPFINTPMPDQRADAPYVPPGALTDLSIPGNISPLGIEAEGRETTMPTGESELLYDEKFTSPLSTATAPAATPQFDAAGNLIASPGYSDWIKRMQLFGAVPQFIPNLTTPGTGGLDISAGDLYKQKKAEAVKNYENRLQAIKDAGQLTPEIENMLKSNLDAGLEQLNQQETSYLNSLPQRQTLSDLLKANKFEEAYKFAQDNGMQSLLLQTDQLRDLRSPFTKDEAKAFMKAMPSDFIKNSYADSSSFDEGWDFDPEGAEERGALTWIKTDPSGQFMTSEPGKPVLSDTGYPMLDRVLKAKEVKKKDDFGKKLLTGIGIAAAIFGGAHLLGALGGAGGATAAGAGAAGAGAAGAAGAGALGAAALPTFTIATGGGLTAAQLAALGAAGVGAGALAGGAGAAPTSPLEEVVVTGSRGFTPSLQNALASTATGAGVQDILSERQIAEAREAEARDAEQRQRELEEVIVTGKRPPIVSPVDLATVGGITALAQPLSAQMGYKPPGIETTPVADQGLPEVVVTGTKPVGLSLADIAAGVGGAGALTAGFTQPQVDPLTGELKEPPKTQQELDAIQEALATGKPIPGTASPLNQLRSFLDKLSTAQKIAGILGGLGAAASGRAPSTTPIAGAGGFGGALPKYQLQRTQLQPQIDYYRYGLGPEAKFFEDKLTPVVEQPVTTEGPPAGRVNPEEEPVFAEGGLAKGGRYMEGPGSGREDKIPALLSDGEYVIDAETLALLGDGSTKEGAKRMDQFRANIRKHKGRALSRGRISPDAKSPSKYMGGGLT